MIIKQKYWHAERKICVVSLFANAQKHPKQLYKHCFFVHIKYTLTILTKGIGLFAEYSVQRYLLNTTFAAPFRPRSSMDRIGVS